MTEYFSSITSELDLGQLLQVLILALEAADFFSIGFLGRIAGQPPFTGFQEILAPAVIQVLVDAFFAAKLGNRTFASQAL